jgi:hypothetical protein
MFEFFLNLSCLPDVIKVIFFYNLILRFGQRCTNKDAPAEVLNINFMNMIQVRLG